MKKVMYVPPKLFQKLFPKTIWESRVDKVLFTFDDGPNPATTPIILDKLNEHSIKAVFFCVGENVERYPELSKQIVDEGHLIGNHTQTHKNINFFNREANSNIAKCSLKRYCNQFIIDFSLIEVFQASDNPYFYSASLNGWR